MRLFEDATYARARMLARKGSLEEALGLFKSLADIDESPKHAIYAYRAFHVANLLENYDTAERYITEAIQVDPRNSHWRARRGTLYAILERWQEAVADYEAVVKDPNWKQDPTALSRFGNALDKVGRTSEGVAWVRAAIQMDSSVKPYHENLIRLVRKSGQAKLQADVLTAALKQFPAEDAWRNELQVVLSRTGDNENLLQHAQKQTVENPNDERAWFTLGNALRRMGKVESANSAYQTARDVSKSPVVKASGVGVLFQNAGRYAEASLEYEREILSGNSQFETLFRSGYSLERTYDWERAAERYKQVTLVHQAPEYFYRLGLVLERLRKYEESAAAYEQAIARNPSNKYWHYRLGMVLILCNRHADAISAFAQEYDWGTDNLPNFPLADSVPSDIDPADVDQTNHCHTTMDSQQLAALWSDGVESIRSLQTAKFSISAGIAYCETESYSQAIELIHDGILRTDQHSNKLYAALAAAYAGAGNIEASAHVFSCAHKLQRPHGISTTQYDKSPWQKLSYEYSEYLDTLPIDDSAILYESYAGSSISCNPLAIFNELISRDSGSQYRHFWVINADTRIPGALKGRPNVYFVTRGSDLYLKLLATAKYLVNNNTFAPYFIRRDEQKYLNTWHGTPVKTLGRRIKGGRMDHANAARNLLHATHLALPNIHTATVLITDNDLAGSLTAKTSITGYPRNDILVSSSRKQVADEVRRQLDISLDDVVVLYAPTWRGDLGGQILDEEQLRQTLSTMTLPGVKVLFRGHHMVESLLSTATDLPAIVPSGDIETAELLATADILVTDYSSIAFDFAPRNRPIIYWAYDYSDYEAERGFCLPLGDLPGTVAKDLNTFKTQMESAVLSLTSGNTPDYSSEIRRFNPMDDGHAARRVVDWFFEDEQLDLETYGSNDSRKSVLFFQGSFIPNGITSAFESVIRGIDQTKVRAVVTLEPSAIYADPSRIERFDEVKDEFQVLARSGGQVTSLEERWIIDRLNSQQHLDHPRQWEIYAQGFQREFHRMFGNAQFDDLVVFEGYARFWLALFAFAKQNSARRVAYLHNDMMHERKTRFHYLESVFSMYRQFDKLVSVSKSVHEVNLHELGQLPGLSQEQFDYVNNQISIDRINDRAKAMGDPDLIAWLDAGDYAFINVARLSPEKGQKKLLHAFAEVKAQADLDVRLMIVGDGPLRQQLQQETVRLGISSAVKFAGLQENPFPLMKQSDAFVFSSEYEGQGLVVLEALILGIPVLSTDVVGPRSILENGEGVLVENTPEALSDGMLKFIHDRPSGTGFDGLSYNQQARDRFSQIVFGN